MEITLSLHAEKNEEIEFFESRSQQLAANYKNYNYEKKHPPSTKNKVKNYLKRLLLNHPRPQKKTGPSFVYT